jgi:hypothetical protein
MDYPQLYRLEVQKYFAGEINKLRLAAALVNGVNLEPNPLWVPAIKAMFDRYCMSRVTDEFLISKYQPKDKNSELLNKKLNVEVITLLIVSALVNPKAEQKIFFCSEALSTPTACDIVAVIKRNFVDYELMAAFNSAPTYRTVLRLKANK